MEKSMQLHLAGIEEVSSPIDKIKMFYEYQPMFQASIKLAIGAFVLYVVIYMIKQELIQRKYDINREIFDMGLAFLTVVMLFSVGSQLGAAMFFHQTGYYESDTFTVKDVKDDGPRAGDKSLKDLKITPENGEPFVITVSKNNKSSMTEGREYKIETKRMILSNNSSKRIDPDQMVVKIKDINQ